MSSIRNKKKEIIGKDTLKLLAVLLPILGVTLGVSAFVIANEYNNNNVGLDRTAQEIPLLPSVFTDGDLLTDHGWTEGLGNVGDATVQIEGDDGVRIAMHSINSAIEYDYIYDLGGETSEFNFITGISFDSWLGYAVLYEGNIQIRFVGSDGNVVFKVKWDRAMLFLVYNDVDYYIEGLSYYQDTNLEITTNVTNGTTTLTANQLSLEIDGMEDIASIRIIQKYIVTRTLIKNMQMTAII